MTTNKFSEKWEDEGGCLGTSRLKEWHESIGFLITSHIYQRNSKPEWGGGNYHHASPLPPVSKPSLYPDPESLREKGWWKSGLLTLPHLSLPISSLVSSWVGTKLPPCPEATVWYESGLCFPFPYRQRDNVRQCSIIIGVLLSSPSGMYWLYGD